MALADSPTKWTARLKRLSARLPSRAKLIGGLSQGLMSAAAAILAYLPTKPLGLQEGFWGSSTAIAVVQSELGATRNSARLNGDNHRVGTASRCRRMDDDVANYRGRLGRRGGRRDSLARQPI
jgi:hypothetical protein